MDIWRNRQDLAMSLMAGTRSVRISNGFSRLIHICLIPFLLMTGLAIASPVINLIQQALPDRLQDRSPPDISQTRLPRAVAEFYAARQWVPVWDDSRYGALLRELADLEGDGLNPEDYGLSSLRQYQGGSRSPAWQARREQLATSAYLLALIHLYHGKVSPERLDAHWNFDRRPLDPKRGLALARAAVENNSIHQLFERARPPLPQYKALKSALANLRKIAQTGGWPTFPGGPVLKPEMSDARIPLLRQRLVVAGLLADTSPSAATIYDKALVSAVTRFQRESYLDADGVLGGATLRELNIPVEQRIGQVRANLERMRWYIGQIQEDFVLVDIAGYRIHYIRNNKPVWGSRIQIGKAYRRTPAFKSWITHITLNPTWTVPPTILHEDSLPAIRQNLDYLSRNRIRVLDASGRELSPDNVNWNNPGRITLRQDAGPGNSLGQLVLRMPNPYSVYMHDTPHQELFNAQQRAFSSGCIRVENIVELAVMLLADPQKWNRAELDVALATNKTQEISLARKVPVLIAYWTVDIGIDGYVSFKPDIYGQDLKVLKALDDIDGSIWQ